MYKNIISILFFTSAWSIILTSASPMDVKTNSACGDVGDCMLIESETECKEKCGCDKTIPVILDHTTQECVIDLKLLISSLTEKYNTEDNKSMEYDMATHIRAEANRIFQGIIFAALFFITCASICVLTACVYCCRMNYSDYQLKKSVKVLAKKVGSIPQRRPTVQAPIKPISESCNVIVEEAGSNGLGPSLMCKGQDMTEISLIDTVLMTSGVLIAMALLSCLCCICMKLSDLKMKRYILEMADHKGIKIDLDKLDPKHNSQSPQSSENCTIIIPEVAIII